MKKLSFSLIAILFCSLSFAQTGTSASFQPGWYIIQKGANYGVILPSYVDAAAETGTPKEVDKNSLTMNVGEVVLAYEQKGGNTYCFDPLGRLLVFQNGLQKAPINAVSSVGIISKDIELLEGDDLKAGAYVWIVGQDVAKSTLKIQLAGNKILEVPKDSIELISKVIRSIAKEEIEFKPAQ